VVRFPLRYGLWRPLLSVVGMGPKFSGVEVGDDVVTVRMGLGFTARLPRGSITASHRTENIWWAIGVHGWRGDWLVNGSVGGLVALDISPKQRARVLCMPIRLHHLIVGVQDPEGLVEMLHRQPVHG
jgi:hypothetical protein